MHDGMRWPGIAVAAIVGANASGQSLLEWLSMNVPTAVSANGDVVVGYNYLAPRAANAARRWTRTGGSESLPHLSAYADSAAYGVSDDGSTAVGYSADETGLYRPVLWKRNAGPTVIPFPDGWQHNGRLDVSIATRTNFDGSVVFGTLFAGGCEGTYMSYRAWVWDMTNGTRFMDPAPTMQLDRAVRCDASGSRIFIEGRLCAGGTGLSAYLSGVLDGVDGQFMSFAAPAGFTVFSGLYASRDLSAAAGWAMVKGVDDRVAYIHRPPTMFRRVCAASGGGGLLEPLLTAVGANGGWAAGFASPDGSSNSTEAFYWTPERGMFRLTEYLVSTDVEVPSWVKLRSVVDASADGLVLVGESDAGAWIATLQPVSTCRFDLNFDGVVDDADFTRFVLAYNNVFDAAADANEDCITDDSDFNAFVAAYNAVLCV